MKKLIIILLIALVGGVVAYLYVFHKPHRDLMEEDARHEIPAEQLLTDFTADGPAANTKYLDHVITVGGVVSNIDSASITLEPGVFCHFHEQAETSAIKPGDWVDIKGRVVGYDELFGEVKLDYCSLVD